jgi:hypothetical protein
MLPGITVAIFRRVAALPLKDSQRLPTNDPLTGAIHQRWIRHMSRMAGILNLMTTEAELDAAREVTRD